MNISGEDVEEIEISYMFSDAGANDTSNDAATELFLVSSLTFDIMVGENIQYLAG